MLLAFGGSSTSPLLRLGPEALRLGASCLRPDGLGGAAASIKRAATFEFLTMGARDYSQITVYADEEQKRQIERSAEAAGMSVSSYLRELGTNEEPTADREAREEEIEELKELRRLLGNMGRSLNQIAYHANRSGGVSEEGVLRARRLAEETKDQVIEKLEELY